MIKNRHAGGGPRGPNKKVNHRGHWRHFGHNAGINASRLGAPVERPKHRRRGFNDRSWEYILHIVDRPQ